MGDNDSKLAALLERLKDFWSKQGVRIQPGVSNEEIGTFESRYQVQLPPDLREYFTSVNGMQRWETDKNMFSFLPIHAIKNIPEELAHCRGIPDYRDIVRTLADPHCWFVIVDYLITSAVYAVRFTADIESTPVLWIGNGVCHRIVAPTFADFLEAYLANPYELL